MRIDIITIFPDFMKLSFQYSILKRIIDKKIAVVEIHNLRDYSKHKDKRVDDYQYGGGAGIVLSIEPLDRCITFLKSKHQYDEIIYLTPDGKTFNQQSANQLSLKKNLLFICGHYKGIDQRIRDCFVTSEFSIGDFVLTGGELPVLAVCDAIMRLIPGAVTDASSVLNDTFQDGLLASPVYTRPENYRGMKVPKILVSGHERKIEAWRDSKAIEKTIKHRPDLLP